MKPLILRVVYNIMHLIKWNVSAGTSSSMYRSFSDERNFHVQIFSMEVQWVAAGWVHEHSMKQTPKTIKLLLLMDDQ